MPSREDVLADEVGRGAVGFVPGVGDGDRLEDSSSAYFFISIGRLPGTRRREERERKRGEFVFELSFSNVFDPRRKKQGKKRLK